VPLWRSLRSPTMPLLTRVHKAATSYRCDAGRMEVLLAWFREYPAESITAQDIERQFQKQEWAPATPNRYRALLSLTYRLAIRNGKVKENPARLVAHRHEDNARIRFLSADEEENLRKAMEKRCPERMPEFDLALNTGVRLSEQYGLLWENVSIPLQTLTIPRSKNGSTRHVPLNQGPIKALKTLRKQHPASEFVCGGAKEPRRWFERARGCKGLKLQLALLASHVRKPTRDGRCGHSHRARACRPQDSRDDREIFASRSEAHNSQRLRDWTPLQRLQPTPLPTPGPQCDRCNTL
jgi:integrase